MTGTLVSTCFPADPKKRDVGQKLCLECLFTTLFTCFWFLFEWPKSTVRNARLLGSTKYYMYTQKFIWVSWQSFLHKWQPMNSVKWAVEPSPAPKVDRLFTFGFCFFGRLLLSGDCWFLGAKIWVNPSLENKSVIFREKGISVVEKNLHYTKQSSKYCLYVLSDNPLQNCYFWKVQIFRIC